MAALLAALVAVATMSLSAGAQDSCRRTEHLGDLRSHQTITRVGLLNSSSCRFDGVRYYDYYDFQLTGAGEIRFSLSSLDFVTQVVLNTISGEFLAAAPVGLTRTLPAGGYKVIAVSNGTEDAGSYTLRIRTGQLAAPPPPPPPPPPDPLPGLSIALGVEGHPGGAVIVPDRTTIAVTAGLVHEGANQGPHSVSDIVLRIAGPFAWEGNGQRTVRISGQLVHCAAEGGQVRCPLDLTANGQKAAITIPRGTPAGSSFTISASTSVRGATLTDSLTITVAPTPPAGGGSQTESSASAGTVSGRVIARVLPLPDGHRGGRYRIEFGFLSVEVLASGSNRDSAVEANAHLLPPSRYLTEAELLARSQADNRRWLRSSPIDVLPSEDDDAGLSGEPLLTGRVIVRWNPSAGGAPRVEFGFLPDWASTAAGGDTQRAAELHSELLPASRYLTQSAINRELRRDQPRWLASSVVEIEPPTEQVLLVTWDRGGYRPASASIGGAVELVPPRVTSPTSTPPGVTWEYDTLTADVCSVDSRTGALRLIAEGACRVTVTARAPGYAPGTASAQVTVEDDGPTIDSVSCFPPRPSVGDSVTCTARLSGGEPDEWLWVSGSSNSMDRTFTTTFDAPGRQTVWLSVSNSAGSDTDSATVEVQPLPDEEPAILSINCPSSVGVNDAVTCTANVTGTEPLIYSWSGGDSSGRDQRYRTSFSSSGTKTVWLTVRNSAGSDSGRASVVVIEPNGPTCIEPTSLHATLDLAKADGDPHSLAIAQVCEGDNLRFSARSSDTAVATISTPSGSRGEVVFRAADSGEAQITLTATDREGRSARVTFTVTVIGEEVDPPIVTINCSPSSIDEGESVTCSVTRNDGGAIDIYDWSASGGRPSSGSSSPDHSLSFSSEGRYTVRLTARNAGGSDSASATVRVGNRPPETVGSIPNVTVAVGWGRDVENLGSYFRDPDGDRLTYEASSTSTSIVGTRIWERNPDEVVLTGRSKGAVTITVTARDGKGGTATQRFRATAAPRPSRFVYCQPDTIKVYYLNPRDGEKHHLDITAGQFEDLFGRSVWSEITTMSSSDCALWSTGSAYDYNEARGEVEDA